MILAVGNRRDQWQEDGRSTRNGGGGGDGETEQGGDELIRRQCDRLTAKKSGIVAIVWLKCDETNTHMQTVSLSRQLWVVSL